MYIILPSFLSQLLYSLVFTTRCETCGHLKQLGQKSHLNCAMKRTARDPKQPNRRSPVVEAVLRNEHVTAVWGSGSRSAKCCRAVLQTTGKKQQNGNRIFLTGQFIYLISTQQSSCSPTRLEAERATNQQLPSAFTVVMCMDSTPQSGYLTNICNFLLKMEMMAAVFIIKDTVTASPLTHLQLSVNCWSVLKWVTETELGE